MQKLHRHFIENQAKIKVAAQAVPQSDSTAAGNIWFLTLAAVFAGVFYFWAYYFWGDWWRALAGG